MSQMEIGIIGLPGCGKSTVFNAVTRGTVPTGPYGGTRGEVNLGVVKVRDERLDTLGGVLGSERQVAAEFTFVDPPIASEAGGVSGELLNRLQAVDALLVVTRAFDDPSVPPPAEGVDPVRDAESTLYELTFADLEIVERRLARIALGLKGAKTPERDALNKETSLLERLKADLEDGNPIRDRRLSPDEARSLEGFRFLTAKPFVVVANVGEGDLAGLPALEDRLTLTWRPPGATTAALCGKLEMELTQMGPEDEREFRESLGLVDAGPGRIVGLCHDVLELITFFTGNSREVRAWTVKAGTTALEAAGKIHSDMERGFIRAEVVGFDDLARCGSLAATRSEGLLRREGRDYVVREGDVINVLFNV